MNIYAKHLDVSAIAHAILARKSEAVDTARQLLGSIHALCGCDYVAPDDFDFTRLLRGEKEFAVVSRFSRNGHLFVIIPKRYMIESIREEMPGVNNYIFSVPFTPETTGPVREYATNTNSDTQPYAILMMVEAVVENLVED